jgi:hypothetical protein
MLRTSDELAFLDGCLALWLPRNKSEAEGSAFHRDGKGMLSNLLGRWAGLGPYYAMFPMSFALATVQAFCPSRGGVLDPFAGRGTSIFAAAGTGRRGLGVEVQPAGWIYGKTKLHPARAEDVIVRIEQLGGEVARLGEGATSRLPEFFRWCFCDDVLRFLVHARRRLDWRASKVDRTLMGFILNYLHNSANRGLSNQMHQARSMAPEYSLAWWKARRMRPPRKDPVLFLGARIAWRYKLGMPQFRNSTLLQGDSLRLLPSLEARTEGFHLLFTSPPYYDLVNYHKDQWLRLWMLGEAARPSGEHISTGNFQNYSRYQRLLFGVFERSAALMRRDACIYVRTDAREATLSATFDALRYAFPRRRIRLANRPFSRDTQTVLFGDKGRKPGEVDLVIAPRKSVSGSRLVRQ